MDDKRGCTTSCQAARTECLLIAGSPTDGGKKIIEKVPSPNHFAMKKIREKQNR